jgi:hypothetical protein
MGLTESSDAENSIFAVTYHLRYHHHGKPTHCGYHNGADRP